MARITSMILAAGLTLAACNQASEQRSADALNSAKGVAENAGDRIENAAENAIDALKPTPDAQDFVNLAARSDAFEIAAAKLASANATSAEVKAFAVQMIKAHSESAAKIKAAAGKARPAVMLNPDLTAGQKKDLDELRQKKGAAFDEEYIDGQVDAHEDALALMRSYAADGTDAALKAAAGEIAPVVEGHLKMARALESKTDR